jgi:hypothetical protein
MWHTLETKENAYRSLVGKPEIERPARKLRLSGKIIIKCNLKNPM